ncbi:MAG: LLM class flavin-dependent oxidoreductase [Acidimicrobiales bacterium]|jgi:alkanesulfonate monooxygenase SsuD/methylene tetrahydromethanopterin reductase-like flavin-dependent oxidoreductase (luciferase family)
MKYGVFLPLVGELAEPSRAVNVAREAEGAGWDGLFVSDLVESREGGATESDAFITLAAITSVTTRMQLGLVTPAADRRRPWVLARQSAVIDHLSQGRLIFGTGVGHASWYEGLTVPESAARGGEEDARTSLFEESLAVLLLCWSGDPVRHEGRWMQVDSPPFLPTPLQRPRVPVWVTAEWPRRTPLRRAARLDGILPVFTENLDARVPPDTKDVRAIREELRRLDAPAHHDLALRGVLGPRWSEQSVDHLRALENAGATWWFETVEPGEAASSVFERVAAGPPEGH